MVDKDPMESTVRAYSKKHLATIAKDIEADAMAVYACDPEKRSVALLEYIGEEPRLEVGYGVGFVGICAEKAEGSLLEKKTPES